MSLTMITLFYVHIHRTSPLQDTHYPSRDSLNIDLPTRQAPPISQPAPNFAGLAQEEISHTQEPPSRFQEADPHAHASSCRRFSSCRQQRSFSFTFSVSYSQFYIIGFSKVSSKITKIRQATAASWERYIAQKAPRVFCCRINWSNRPSKTLCNRSIYPQQNCTFPRTSLLVKIYKVMGGSATQSTRDWGISIQNGNVPHKKPP